MSGLSDVAAEAAALAMWQRSEDQDFGLEPADFREDAVLAAGAAVAVVLEWLRENGEERAGDSPRGYIDHADEVADQIEREFGRMS